ncbi:MBL fold metallo-hydrolase [Bacillus sp. B1-b2]|uniref:MBL fold metallo-hydrolase n=1 Tax=Bacillus sp. B1-b2 TaxID=2653201 RepID=UPI0012621B9C|nr:MBL fold metallo-hydrolase [Bacillus sp. B1-b2]KAB7667787.1 MBL fold metallo-hydrolase [Bacillus sp. B1-b2]
MRVRQHQFLYQLTFLPTIFPVNCYIVEEENEFTLIDTALPNSYKKILHFAKTLNKPITKIVLTHAHGDHIGSLDSLKNELPHAKVYISERDARILGGDHSIDKEEEPFVLRGGLPKNIKTKPDVLLKDGDLIGSLTSIALPGHTPGSFGFLDNRNNSLIAGDAFHTRGGFAITGQLRVLFPFPGMATWNKKVAIQSAKKVQSLGVTLMATGHGDLLENPNIERLL